MSTITDILAECDKALVLAEKATPGPWTERQIFFLHDRTIQDPKPNGRHTISRTTNTNEDRAFIAHSRTFTPDAARATKSAIEINRAIYQDHLAEAAHNQGYIGMPTGPCSCPSCKTIRAILNSFTHEQH